MDFIEIGLDRFGRIPSMLSCLTRPVNLIVAAGKEGIAHGPVRYGNRLQTSASNPNEWIIPLRTDSSSSLALSLFFFFLTGLRTARVNSSLPSLFPTRGRRKRRNEERMYARLIPLVRFHSTFIASYWKRSIVSINREL